MREGCHAGAKGMPRGREGNATWADEIERGAVRLRKEKTIRKKEKVERERERQ